MSVVTEVEAQFVAKALNSTFVWKTSWIGQSGQLATEVRKEKGEGLTVKKSLKYSHIIKIANSHVKKLSFALRAIIKNLEILNTLCRIIIKND